jgi:formimidoylglutamate deiminase
MQTLFARHALCPQGWQENLRLTIADGHISTLENASTPQQGDTRVDALLPAMPNLHSHTFQRAMAGMTETRGAGPDSFWTWRDLMYRFLAHLTPEDIESIAAFAFMEMLEQGYASVAEFHYLHHQPDGSPYQNRSELSARILAAAETTGIGLTLLPVLYSYAGLAKQPLQGGQRRFANTLPDYMRLTHDVNTLLRNHPNDYRSGTAPHSLRATSHEQLRELKATGPIHMHIAEQQREVDEVELVLGARPVRWLLDNIEVNDKWCLIHATQMDQSETRDLAASGAVAGLCPVTESNLGDGIFNGNDYAGSHGRYGIGTDSNVRISVSQELATLEYSQRLRERQRNVLAGKGQSTGQSLYVKACAGGAQALQRSCGRIAEGQLADLVALDVSSPTLSALKPAQWLDGWIFASASNCVTDVWSAGRHCVREGRHVNSTGIMASYHKTMTRLIALL